jgi:hypothetical protein
VLIRPLLERQTFGPEHISALVSALEGSLEGFAADGPSDPAVLMVARRIIALAKAGQSRFDSATRSGRQIVQERRR